MGDENEIPPSTPDEIPEISEQDHIVDPPPPEIPQAPVEEPKEN